MIVVNMHEAKTTLSQLLRAAERGEDVVIARSGVPIARLVPVRPALAREPGAWRTHPGWKDFRDDPATTAPLTGAGMAGEGWP